ncbi:MAG: IS200/IS605 family transposase [Bacteroidales bacterium]|nr:IS200/IS605 family transposase [Bacteroidales bacterium]
MSNVTALYHIVFCTKAREMVLPPDHLEDLYRFIWRKIEDTGCKLLRIGGIQNHVHLLVDLHQTVSLAKLVQDIKGHSSGWMKSDIRFRYFTGWAKEYFASTVSPEHKYAVIEYIKNQKTHHNQVAFDEELTELYHRADQQLTSYDMR